MLLYETELKQTKEKIKKIIILLILLLVLGFVYYIYSIFLWNSKVFIKNQLLGGDKMTEVNLGYNINNIEEIIIKFDNSFMELENYKNLQARPYENLSSDKPGRTNPFELYK